MEIRLDSKTGRRPSLESLPAEMMEVIQKHCPDWEQRLATQPGSFEQLERDIHGTFKGLADLFLAGLLEKTTQTSAWQGQAKN